MIGIEQARSAAAAALAGEKAALAEIHRLAIRYETPTRLRMECRHPEGAGWWVWFEMGPDDATLVARYARRWWVSIEDRRARATGLALLRGEVGAAFPADIVVRRLLETRGSSWSDLLHRVRAVLPHGGTLQDMNHAYASYKGHAPPVFEHNCYRRSYRFDGDGIPATQIAFGHRDGLRVDMAVSDSVMWTNTGRSQVWILERFPDSILQGMRGAGLVDVVRHDAFAIDGLAVKSARWDGRKTILEVAQFREDVGDAAVPLTKAA